MEITLEDIEFGPVEGRFLSNVPTLYARLSDGQLTIREVSWEVWSGAVPAEETDAAPPIWSGPVDEARFVYEATRTQNVLKDSAGRVLWARDADSVSPDLLLESTEDGEARLVGKDGTLLWSGTLPFWSKENSPQNDTLSQRSSPPNHRYWISSCGVHVIGDNEAVTVTDTDNRLLWSGTLSQKPIIFLRRADRFAFMGRYGSGHGMEYSRYKNAELQFAAEPGTATMENYEKKVIDTRPVMLLKSRETTTMTELPQTLAVPPQTIVLPSSRLQFITPKTTVTRANDSRLLGGLVVFKDSSGKVVHRESVHRRRAN